MLVPSLTTPSSAQPASTAASASHRITPEYASLAAKREAGTMPRPAFEASVAMVADDGGAGAVARAIALPVGTAVVALPSALDPGAVAAVHRPAAADEHVPRPVDLPAPRHPHVTSPLIGPVTVGVDVAGSRLGPVAVDPDITIALLLPAALHPVVAGLLGLPASRPPDVSAAGVNVAAVHPHVARSRAVVV